MTISTLSSFYYGYEITELNQNIPLNEGSGELNALLEIGAYTAQELAVAVQDKLNGVGDLTYTVTFDRSNRRYTIAATGTFSLLFATGITHGASAAAILGYTATDKTGTNTYTGSTATGTSYEPQFVIQDYVDQESFQQAIDATVNESTDGIIQVIKFGTRKFIEFSIKFVTNRTMDNVVIVNDATAVTKLQTFLQWCCEKQKIEFNPNKSSAATYYTIVLDRTPESDKGVSYKLKEQYSRGLPGFYETGVLRFRVIE